MARTQTRPRTLHLPSNLIFQSGQSSSYRFHRGFTMMRTTFLAVTLVFFGAAFAPAVLAEADPAAPADQSASSDPSNPAYSDKELQSFAVAVLEVERIKSSY